MYTYLGGVFSVMVIVTENGINELSSKPGGGCLRFFAQMPLRKAWIHLFSLIVYVQIEPTGFSSLDEATTLAERKLNSNQLYST